MSPKDDLKNNLIKSGWNITNESIDEFLAEQPNLNLGLLTQKVLNCDLRNIGSKCLPDGVVAGKSDNLEANCVLQLVKLRNIGAPKDNEHSQTAPPMYKLVLTDGTSNCNCLTLDNIQNLNLNTPPGTKIYLNGQIKIKSNLLLLNPKNTKVLGGNVDYLVEKWKLTKDLSKHVRSMGLTDTPPPPWVPFGTSQKIQIDTTKKVFEQVETSQSDQVSEFSETRKAILAEAMEEKAKLTKTFAKQNIDKSQIVVETKPQIQKPEVLTSTLTTKQNPKKGRKGKFRDFDNEEDYSDAKNTARPPTASTLFDLFKTKLDITDDENDNNLPQEAPRVQQNYRGNRNKRQNPRNQQQQQQPITMDTNKNKQVYNPNDFNFDLGGNTKLNSSKQNQTETNKALDQLNKPKQATNKPNIDTITTTTNPTNTNYNNNNNNNYNYNNNNNNFRRQDNNRNNYNQNFNQQAQAMAPLPFQQQQQQQQQYNPNQEYYNRTYNNQGQRQFYNNNNNNYRNYNNNSNNNNYNSNQDFYNNEQDNYYQDNYNQQSNRRTRGNNNFRRQY